MDIGHIVLVIGDWVIRMPTWVIVILILTGGAGLVKISWGK